MGAYFILISFVIIWSKVRYYFKCQLELLKYEINWIINPLRDQQG